MKLGDIKGKRQIQVVGKLMEMADSLSGDEQFDAFMNAMKGDGREKALFKLGPLLARDDVADAVLEVVAFAKGVKPSSVKDPMGEIVELLASDVELPAFLSEQQ